MNEQIEEVRGLLDGLSSDLDAEIRDIQAEAQGRILAAVAASRAKQASMMVRLANLSAAANMIGIGGEVVDVPLAAVSHPTDGPRKSPTDIILRALLSSGEPVLSTTLDNLVTAAGWTKSAAEKTKTRLRETGAVVREDRHYSITKIGRERIGGQSPPKE
ncbi:hypothetical protein [Antarcticirhabdus aurantiaca]|uniref:Uncharacterized protein n=1 Tax=Antarcticirhabdus aurantiaca TaxID=2606717 RepID=A0ACD4NRZ7_9HYPH|nr:hypothetical protein [Antarcticirhabdus aurantiaca]WAJ29420.1 hypothetical protein OXU80_04060 [Jeongeuplla avenae]